jgi:calcineurin-like phosphoesterase family protein
VQKVWFSSDLHYNHKNICAGVTSWIKPENWPIPYNEWRDIKTRRTFCTAHGLRDFKNLEDMNLTIINRINEKVTQNDILFLLGDIAFGGQGSIDKLMSQIICQNVHCIFGNHDKNLEKNVDNCQRYFKSCDYYKEIEVDGQFIVLFHYAMRIFNREHKSGWALYGHSHGKLPDDKNSLSIDCGVDTNLFYPYSFRDIKHEMSKKTFKPVDSHGRVHED